jgi:hypothetical protein
MQRPVDLANARSFFLAPGSFTTRARSFLRRALFVHLARAMASMDGRPPSVQGSRAAGVGVGRVPGHQASVMEGL